MDFFDDINKAIENAGNTAKQKTRDLTDIVKMNNAIKEEEKNLQDIYRSIGEIFVKKYYSETEKSLRNLVSQARETEQNIELYTTKVQEIKKVDTCPKCGKEIQSGAAFCINSIRKRQNTMGKRQWANMRQLPDMTILIR